MISDEETASLLEDFQFNIARTRLKREVEIVCGLFSKLCYNNRWAPKENIV